MRAVVKIDVHEAETRLSQLVELAEKGERVVIAREGVPVVELVPFTRMSGARRGGQWQGRARIAADFDAPLPEADELFGT